MHNDPSLGAAQGGSLMAKSPYSFLTDSFWKEVQETPVTDAFTYPCK